MVENNTLCTFVGGYLHGQWRRLPASQNVVQVVVPPKNLTKFDFTYTVNLPTETYYEVLSIDRNRFFKHNNMPQHSFDTYIMSGVWRWSLPSSPITINKKQAFSYDPERRGQTW